MLFLFVLIVRSKNIDVPTAADALIYGIGHCIQNMMCTGIKQKELWVLLCWGHNLTQVHELSHQNCPRAFRLELRSYTAEMGEIVFCSKCESFFLFGDDSLLGFFS